MLSVEQTKEMLSSLNLSDQEAADIRDIAYMLADITYQSWINEKKKLAKSVPKSP